MPKHATWWLLSLAVLRSSVSTSAYLVHPANVALGITMASSSMLSSVLLHSALTRPRAAALTPLFKVFACASHDEKGVEGLRSTLIPKPMYWHSNPAMNGVVVWVEVGVVVTVVVVVVVVVDSVVVVVDSVMVVEEIVVVVDVTVVVVEEAVVEVVVSVVVV